MDCELGLRKAFGHWPTFTDVTPTPQAPPLFQVDAVWYTRCTTAKEINPQEKRRVCAIDHGSPPICLSRQDRGSLLAAQAHHTHTQQCTTPAFQMYYVPQPTGVCDPTTTKQRFDCLRMQHCCCMAAARD